MRLEIGGSGRAALVLCLLLLPERGWAQEVVSALPPPATRGLYRSHWFEFLTAHLEDDARGAAIALANMQRAARAVGVRWLSDFSRTAVHEARKAEALGRVDRAARAYAAALQLDDANYEAAVSQIEFLVRQRSYGQALRLLPAAVKALLSTQESRLAAFSSFAIWVAAALAGAVLGSILVLLLRYLPRIAHDVGEVAERSFGPAAALPLSLLILALPLAFGLGPVWLLLYWAVLVYAYTEPHECIGLTAGLVVLGLLVPLGCAISRENMIERSPLYVAAVDLEERREDASAVDGLRQASAVFTEDSDVWFLLGMYAERAGDSERALDAYNRAIEVGPKDYRPFLNRGNVHFQEGEISGAIRDYEAAAKRAPDAPEIYYNLSIARGEAYDFEGQAAALAKARQVSEREVAYWSDHPTLARVVSARYPVSVARRKIEQWNAQRRSRRLPGHAPPQHLKDVLGSPFTFAPWVALLLAVGLKLIRSRGSHASECIRCGKPFCKRCKRLGDPVLYCTACVRMHIRKESVGISSHVEQAEEIRRRIRHRDRACRFASLLLPGTHRFISEHPWSGFLTLLAFFLCLAIAWIDEKFFDPRELPPPEVWRFTVFVGLAVALAIWLSSQLKAWRESHGS